MKFLFPLLLVSLTFGVNAQDVIQKYVRSACGCADAEQFASFAAQFREAGSENERNVYTKIKDDYFATKRCTKTKFRDLITPEDRKGPRPRSKELSEALNKECPDVDYVFTTCERIDQELFNEELDADVKKDYDEVIEIQETGDIESTFEMWDSFSKIHGMENTYIIEYIDFSYKNDRDFYGDLSVDMLLEALKYDILTDYREDKSIPVKDFILTSILTIAEKHGKEETIQKVNAFKMPEE